MMFGRKPVGNLDFIDKDMTKEAYVLMRDASLCDIGHAEDVWAAVWRCVVTGDLVIQGALRDGPHYLVRSSRKLPDDQIVDRVLTPAVANIKTRITEALKH